VAEDRAVAELETESGDGQAATAQPVLSAPPSPMPPRPKRQPWWPNAGALGLIAALAAFAVTSKDLVTSSWHLTVWTFVAIIVVLTAFTVLMGWRITGQALGALIDGKKGRMSMSRLQTLLWTILVLAAYLTAFIVNVSLHVKNPLEVAIPGELLAAMGISLTSLAGTKLVLGYKQNQPNTAGVPARVIQTLQERQVAFDATTRVLYASRAQISDVFQGDTPESATFLDLGKVQLFYITIALVAGYAIATGDLLSHVSVGNPVASLPGLDKSFVALLALSHAGYLTTKAAS
jgi:hypothetical protein